MQGILLSSEILKDNCYKGLWYVARWRLWKPPAGTKVIVAQVIFLPRDLY